MPKQARSIDVKRVAKRQRSPPPGGRGLSQRKTRKENPPEEKRLLPYRSRCSADTHMRIERAETQRMFLIKHEKSSDTMWVFDVLGSTGNVYTVTVSNLLTCTCPDAEKGNHCKHLLFVLLKVLRCPPHNPTVWQRALLSSELATLFGNAPRALDESIVACRSVREALEGGGEVARKKTEGEQCLICCENFVGKEALVWCRWQCGTNFHNGCFAHWKKTKGRDVTCPFCRALWTRPNPIEDTNDEGYKNLGSLQGLPLTRDTSTYYAPQPRRIKAWWYHKDHRYDEDDGDDDDEDDDDDDGPSEIDYSDD